MIFQGEGWHMRLAGEADNARLCALFRDVDTSGNLVLAEERDPDFFALQRAQGGANYTVALVDDENGYVFGCLSILARDAWLNGEIKRIGYASDLRIEQGYRKGRIFPLAVEHFMKFMQSKEGIDFMYCAVLSSNARGRNALFNRASHRSGQPEAQVMTPYKMTSIQFTKSVPKPLLPISRATEEDLPELVAFLAKQQQQRFLGEVVDHDWLERRFQNWQEFDLESFYLLRGGDGEILACTAIWDCTPSVRRERVLSYQGAMRWIKRLYNIGSFVRGFAPLPEEGGCFDFVYLTHLEVADQDPKVLQQLLRGMYHELYPQKRHFMSVMLPEGSSLEDGVKGFHTQQLDMELIALTNEHSSFHGKKLTSTRPGFEMALH